MNDPVKFENGVLRDIQPLTDSRTLANGEKVKRLQILKLATGTELAGFDEYDSDSNAFCVAAQDADATSGATSVEIFTQAQLAEAAVAEATGLDEISEGIKNALWDRGIHIARTEPATPADS